MVQYIWQMLLIYPPLTVPQVPQYYKGFEQFSDNETFLLCLTQHSQTY